MHTFSETFTTEEGVALERAWVEAIPLFTGVALDEWVATLALDTLDRTITTVLYGKGYHEYVAHQEDWAEFDFDTDPE